VSPDDLYSPEAEEQLDALAGGPDAELYNAVLDAIDRVLDDSDGARAISPPLRDGAGRPIFATVVMYERDPCWFVFWSSSSGEPVILGVAPLPSL
jgi:hypothetical protein